MLLLIFLILFITALLAQSLTGSLVVLFIILECVGNADDFIKKVVKTRRNSILISLYKLVKEKLTSINRRLIKDD